ncbi:hypothetical protein HEQ45_04405 [Lactobacillus sp. ZJLC29-4]|nr:hypothetical protein [Lactobacillus sp. HBUAS51387]
MPIKDVIPINSRTMVASIVSLSFGGLLAWLIIRLITDFQTTLLVVLALVIAGFIKTHFIKTRDR